VSAEILTRASSQAAKNVDDNTMIATIFKGSLVMSIFEITPILVVITLIAMGDI